MRRGNFFRRNQYKIAAVCVLAAVLGLTGMYVFRGRQSGEEKKQPVAQNSEKVEKQQVAKAKKEETEKTEKKTETKTETKTKTEEKEPEQTARVSAIVKPKQYEVTEEDKAGSAGSEGGNKTAAQAQSDGQAVQEQQTEQTGQAQQTGQEQQTEQKKTSEAGSAKTSAPAKLHFNEKDGLLWPVDGAVILDYSMDHTVYFATLDQYKYNPAVIISGNVNDKVKAAANGKITDISVNEVTGCTVTMDLGDGYTAIYGQLKEVPYKKGAYLEAGDSLGFVSEPTKYYSLEGSNLYFALEKDGTPVDPVELFAIQSEE